MRTCIVHVLFGNINSVFYYVAAAGSWGTLQSTAKRRSKHTEQVLSCPYAHTFPSVSFEAVLGVWLPAALPTPRALPDHGAIWPLAVGVEKYLGGIDV